jgi:hypothetical protein
VATRRPFSSSSKIRRSPAWPSRVARGVWCYFGGFGGFNLRRIFA